jgi:hypothetical protein
MVLSLVYVLTYYVLVVPQGIVKPMIMNDGRAVGIVTGQRYRWANSKAKFVFFPLEKLDRKLRPNAWLPPHLR